MSIDTNTITTIAEADAALSRAVLTLQMVDLTVKSLSDEIREAVATYGDVPMNEIVSVDTESGKRLPYSTGREVRERMGQTLGQKFDPQQSHRTIFASLLPTDLSADRITCVDSQYQPVVDLMIRVLNVAEQRRALRSDWYSIGSRYGILAESDPHALDGLYVAAKTSRRSAQGYASATRRNKTAITITGDAMHHGMLPYNRLPGGHTTKQTIISTTRMYRRYVDRFGKHSFIFEDTDDMRFTFADSTINVLLPRSQARARRAAVAKYVSALTEVRATALTDITAAMTWETDHRPLVRKQQRFDELMRNVRDLDTWSLGYGETNQVLRQFVSTLLTTVPDAHKDLAIAAAETKAWDTLGGPLTQTEIDTLSQRPAVDKYHGDELWQKIIVDRDLPEMIW